jgi:hypothetical protein
VYITTADLLRLAEQDETIRKAIALYLAEKAKNDTPRQKEIAEKILTTHPPFSISQRLSASLKLPHRESGMYAELARPYVEEVKRSRWMGKLLGLPILSRSAEPGLLEEMVARPGFEIPGIPSRATGSKAPHPKPGFPLAARRPGS